MFETTEQIKEFLITCNLDLFCSGRHRVVFLFKDSKADYFIASASYRNGELSVYRRNFFDKHIIDPVYKARFTVLTH